MLRRANPSESKFKIQEDCRRSKYLLNEWVNACNKIDAHQRISISQLGLFFSRRFSSINLNHFPFWSHHPTIRDSMAGDREDITNSWEHLNYRHKVSCCLCQSFLLNPNNSIKHFYTGNFQSFTLSHMARNCQGWNLNSTLHDFLLFGSFPIPTTSSFSLPISLQ